jgi:hypothetical protein
MTNLDFTKPLTSVTACKDFLTRLHKAGKMFHLDDDPSEFVDDLFTNEECGHLNLRVDEIFEQMEDPFDLCVKLINEEK